MRSFIEFCVRPKLSLFGVVGGIAIGTAYAVQKAFPEIDSKTARDWVNGKCNPSGGFVAAVVAADPAAIKILGGIA